MRKIDAFANEHFDGDIKKALLYLLDNPTIGKMDDFVDELTREEANFVYLELRKKAITHYGGLESYRAELRKQSTLCSLDTTEEDVRCSSVNPFKKPMLKYFFALLASICLSVLLYFVGPLAGISASTVAIGASLFIGIFSLSAAETIIKFFKYRRIKKQIDREYSNEAE